MGEAGHRLSIIMHSGEYDKVHEGFSIANVMLAKGSEVHMLFTYGALMRLKKGHIDDYEFAGVKSPFAESFEKHIKRGAVEPISGLLEMARKLGRFKVYACSGAMAIMNISRDELMEGVDSVTGLVKFLQTAKESDMTLYI